MQETNTSIETGASAAMQRISDTGEISQSDRDAILGLSKPSNNRATAEGSSISGMGREIFRLSGQSPLQSTPSDEKVEAEEENAASGAIPSPPSKRQKTDEGNDSLFSGLFNWRFDDYCGD